MSRCLVLGVLVLAGCAKPGVSPEPAPEPVVPVSAAPPSPEIAPMPRACIEPKSLVGKPLGEAAELLGLKLTDGHGIHEPPGIFRGVRWGSGYEEGSVWLYTGRTSDFEFQITPNSAKDMKVIGVAIVRNGDWVVADVIP